MEEADEAKLKRSGFIQEEIEEFSAQNIDLGLPVWQDVINERKAWIIDKVDRGWSRDDIKQALSDYYAKGKKRNPWDFVKANYKPPKKIDYLVAAKKRAQLRLRPLRNM